ncbi:MAG: glycosyl hydrolase [Chloroflexi bacterium]|nr:glycosyl hydrolase [Chloroflexota bacterium]
MTVDPKLFKGLQWRLVGPHRGGRVVAVHGDPKDPMTFYFGGCAGGVWKTYDGGQYWENISDGFFKTSAIGAIAVSASDPNVIYVGTGETAIRGNVSHGDGVYKSTDAGKTWTNVGLKDTRHIASVQIHPTNPDLVYVAALGHTWGPNKERGVYRSKDSGRTWEQVLFRSEKAGAIDLSLDPNNPRMLYAAVWEAQRYPYKLNSGGPDSSLYKSSDGGDTWTEITRNPGLPKGVLGKMGIVASGAQSGRVYAIIEAEDGALFRSDDGGATWKRMSEEPGLRGRPWYYMHIYADPQDADVCYVLDYSMWKTIDGGATFSEIPTPHGDNHDLWIDPHNPRRMAQGNDGGACISFNGGDSWSSIYNQPTAQLYHVITDNAYPYRLYASQQDNTAISLPSASGRGVLTTLHWEECGGGESGYIAIKPSNPNIIIGGGIGSGAGAGRLIHWDRALDQEKVISVWPENHGMGYGAIAHKYRFQWTFPVYYSRWEKDALYIAGNHIFKSTDDGQSWTVMSPDLSRNDPSRLQPSGGPITNDNTGAETYCIIFALAESHKEAGVVWAGTDDGLVYITRDGMKSWRNITPKGLPEWALISILEPSPHDAGTCYMAATRYKSDDLKPYLFKTTDYGANWTPITDGIPADEFTRTIRADPTCRGLLVAGSETSVYVSLDDGANWQKFETNLPVAPIHDLWFHGTDLIAATHGRSLWILDDVTPLHQMAAATQGAYLFKPRTTVRFRQYKGYGSKPGPAMTYRMAGPLVYAFKVVEKTPGGDKIEKPIDAGENPPEGVIVQYALQEKPEGDIGLRILDAQGNLIREFTSKEATEEQKKAGDSDPRITKDAGANRFVWNMRYPDARKLLDSKGRGGTDQLVAGPMVPPGAYQAQLVAGGQTYTQSFEIVKDPRVQATQADFDAQFGLAVKVNRKVNETHEAIIRLRDLRDQVDGVAKHASAGAVKDAAQKARDALTAVESELVQVKAEDPRQFPTKLNAKVAIINSFVESHDGAPPKQLFELYEDHAAKIDAQLKKLQEVIAGEVAAFNKACKDAGVAAAA